MAIRANGRSRDRSFVAAQDDGFGVQVGQVPQAMICCNTGYKVLCQPFIFQVFIEFFYMFIRIANLFVISFDKLRMYNKFYFISIFLILKIINTYANLLSLIDLPIINYIINIFIITDLIYNITNIKIKGMLRNRMPLSPLTSLNQRFYHG